MLVRVIASLLTRRPSGCTSVINEILIRLRHFQKWAKGRLAAAVTRDIKTYLLVRHQNEWYEIAHRFTCHYRWRAAYVFKCKDNKLLI